MLLRVKAPWNLALDHLQGKVVVTLTRSRVDSVKRTLSCDHADAPALCIPNVSLPVSEGD